MRVTVPCARHAHVGSGAAQRRSTTWMRLWTGSTPPAERLVRPRCALRLPSRALLSVLWAVDMHTCRRGRDHVEPGRVPGRSARGRSPPIVITDPITAIIVAEVAFGEMIRHRPNQYHHRVGWLFSRVDSDRATGTASFRPGFTRRRPALHVMTTRHHVPTPRESPPGTKWTRRCPQRTCRASARRSCWLATSTPTRAST
jgi:hypothetical protein